jgi:hypothetical protein
MRVWRSSDPEQIVSLMLDREPQIGEKRRPLLTGLVESESALHNPLPLFGLQPTSVSASPTD